MFRDTLADLDGVGREQFRGCTLLTLNDDADNMEQLLNRVCDGLYVLCLIVDIDIDMYLLFSAISMSLSLQPVPFLHSHYVSSRSTRYRNLYSIFSVVNGHLPLRSMTPKRQLKKLRSQSNAPLAKYALYSILPQPSLSSANVADLFVPLFYELSSYMWQFSSPNGSYHLDDLALVDMQRFAVGVNKLRCPPHSRGPLSIRRRHS